jgi:hypothetical protein
MRDKVRECDLLIARLFCPGFDPSARSAWRRLIEGMCRNEAIKQIINESPDVRRQLDRLFAPAPGKRGASPPDYNEWVEREYAAFVDEDASRQTKTARTLAPKFKHWLMSKNLNPYNKRLTRQGPKAIENSICQGKSARQLAERKALVEWQARFFLEEAGRAAWGEFGMFRRPCE